MTNHASDRKAQRLSWDDYFLQVADTISKRATCDRGQSGCVTAIGNQILAAGYVGSPPGFPHCDEEGHYFKKVYHEDGSVTEHCVRTIHAEQNAICQAARMKKTIQKDNAQTPCCPLLTNNSKNPRQFHICQQHYKHVYIAVDRQDSKNQIGRM